MAETGKEITQLIDDFLEKPSDVRNKSQLNQYFWNRMDSLIKNKLQGGKSENFEVSEEEALFMDLGVLERRLIDEEVNGLDRLKEIPRQKLPEGYFYFSKWIDRQYGLIMKKDVIKKSRKIISKQKKEIEQLGQEIERFQEQRVSLFELEYRKTLEAKGMYSAASFGRGMRDISKGKAADDLFLKCQKVKEDIESGAFLAPEEKRGFAGQQMELAQAKQAVENAIAEISDDECARRLMDIGLAIETNFIKLVKAEKKLENSRSGLKDIMEEVRKRSAVEVETAIENVIVFNREMMKLSARRKRMEPISVFFGRQTILDLQAVQKILEIAEEFDPKLFRNPRINIVGRPSVVLVPGYGNGLYDWKYNAMIIPTMPMGDPRASVFTASVEYKLDCDEDRLLMASFNKLKEYVKVRSIFALKEKFTKDYITFMTQEAMGYKVLDKEVRQWFEHEVAPSKTSIKIPIKIDPAGMDRKTREKLKEQTLEKIESDKVKPFDHFTMGVLWENEMEDEKSLQSFIKAVVMDNNYLDAIFNAGIMAEKQKEKKIAQKFFNRYMQLVPQSWWSGVCRDHLIKLR